MYVNLKTLEKLFYRTSLWFKSLKKNLSFFYIRALKSPQKFRTSGCSSANFLSSWHTSGLKLKSYYEIWTFWSQLGLQMIQFHEFHSFLKVKCCKIKTFWGDFLDYFSDFFFRFSRKIEFCSFARKSVGCWFDNCTYDFFKRALKSPLF